MIMDTTYYVLQLIVSIPIYQNSSTDDYNNGTTTTTKSNDTDPTSNDTDAIKNANAVIMKHNKPNKVCMINIIIRYIIPEK